MEHLLRPRGATVLDSEKATYVAIPYDGGPFLSYPERSPFKDIHTTIKSSYDANPGNHHVWSDIRPTDVETFVQTWLVFGLLREFFGPAASPTSLTEDTGKRVVLSTENLPAIVGPWITRHDGHQDGDDEEDEDKLFEHLAKCIVTASRTLETVRIKLAIDPIILLTTGTLLETVEDILLQTLYRLVRTIPTTWRECSDKQQLSATMIRNGWCPADISIWHRDRHGGLQLLHYLSKMEQPKIKNHSNCQGNVCVGQQFDMESQNSVHRCSDRSCGMLKVDIKAVKEALDDGYTALLDVTNEENSSELTIDVTSTKHHSSYVALSHVWADGMGNPAANALPRCQLEYVAAIMRQLEKSTGSPKMLVWLDTLCCPVDSDEHRKKCLLLMRKIYQDATYVLIVDLLLSQYKRNELTSVEICARVIFSGWARRLWTMQEGLLAKRLWVQLNDGPVNLAFVEDELSNILVSPSRRIHYKLIVTLLGALKNLRRHHKTFSGALGFDMETLWAALQNRNVSVPTDEPLCMCTCMDLDQELAVRAEDSERMAAFWLTMQNANQAVPVNILFFEGPRLERPGLRWAPASFLRPIVFMNLRTARDKSTQMANLRPEGLKAQLPGFELTSPAPIYTASQPLIPGNEPVYYARHFSGAWYVILFKESPRPVVGPKIRGIVGAGQASIVIVQDKALEDMRIDFLARPTHVAMGLVGVVEGLTCDSVPYRSVSYIQTLKLNDNFNHVFEAAWRCCQDGRLESLRWKPGRDVVTQENLTNNEMTQMLPVAEEALHADHSLALRIDSNTPAEPSITALAGFINRMKDILRGQYFEIGRTWSKEQWWCVD